MGLDSAGKSTLLARLLTGQVRLRWAGTDVPPGVAPPSPAPLCPPLEGDGNVSHHRLQRGNFGPGQEDVSDAVGCGRTEEHETQLEVKVSHTHRRKQVIFVDLPGRLSVWFPTGSELIPRFYLDSCKALVFIVDSSDPGRMPEAQKALRKILAEEKLRGIPLMVLANKKDLPKTMTIREVRAPPAQSSRYRVSPERNPEEPLMERQTDRKGGGAGSRK